MDRDLLIAIGLSMLVLTVWQVLGGVWSAPPVPDAGPEVPRQAERPAVPEAPEPDPGPIGELPTLPEEPALPSGEQIAFERSFTYEGRGEGYRAELNTRGAALQRWELRGYVSGGPEPEPIVLTTGQQPDDLVGVTPFEELGLGDLSRELWQLEARDGESARLSFQREGVTIRKTWSFGDDYTFRVRVDVENGSEADVAPSFAIGWPAHVRDGNDFREQALAGLLQGDLKQELLVGLGQVSLPGRLIGRTPQPVLDFDGAKGWDWAGLQTTYFLGALLPDDPSQAKARISATRTGEAGIAWLLFERVRIPPGLAASREYRGFAGPKHPELLARVGGETIRSIDRGWAPFRPLTSFFGWLLHQIYAVVPNYGVAIILLTVLVRVVTTPLTMKQMRSMERMRAIQPRLKEIQEKFADDRQKQSEAMMALYRREKVNPLGGCLPMLLQLPVFLGLFYALRSSIDLRQAPFFGWIEDLSAPETLFVIPGLEVPIRVLPLIMGGTMVLQQRITPMQMDPAQAKMMMTVMPVVLTVVFYQFPSGLVLYWMVSNVLAIAHQLWVGRQMRAKGAPA